MKFNWILLNNTLYLPLWCQYSGAVLLYINLLQLNYFSGNRSEAVHRLIIGTASEFYLTPKWEDWSVAQEVKKKYDVGDDERSPKEGNLTRSQNDE